MKTSFLKTLTGSALALVVVAGVWSPLFASPEQIKGAQALLGKSSRAPSAETTPVMACGKCKTEFTSQVDTSARGANKPVVNVARHGCGSCDTAIKTVGTGKQASQLAVHSCDMAAIKTKGCCK